MIDGPTLTSLLALFDKHCRDDDWREVLRLICSQIDEQFVGNIATHLIQMANVDEWDGQKLLPEWPLATECLVEARSLWKLDEIWESILLGIAAIIGKYHGMIHHRACAAAYPDDGFLWSIVSAIRTLSSRWVIDGALRQSVTARLASIHGIASTCAIELMDCLNNDRDQMNAIAQGNSRRDREAAIFLLAEKWADNETRVLFEKIVLSDDDPYAGSAALIAMSSKWVDSGTREFLERRGEDRHECVRRAALQAFVEKWPGELSSFGKILITEHLDGREPYLDSHQPIPPEHIERAAAKSEIAAADLDAQIASLNQHLGWDIRVGDRP